MRSIFQWLACLVVALWAAAGSAADELWLVSTRRAGTGAALDEAADVWRLGDDCQWQTQTLGALVERGDAVPTTYFIHGNETDDDRAVEMGYQVYGLLQCHAGARAFRLVIWSWPSERVCRRRRADLQLKACRSNAEAYYLGQCLDRARPETPTCLVGYSYGARVIAGALDLLGGGRFAGYAIGPRDGAARRPVRAVLVAGAADHDWLAPCGETGRALGLVEQMTITRNPCDPVLKWYRLLWGRGGPPAIGYFGPCAVSEPDKVQLLDVAGSVGRAHGWEDYFSASAVRGEIARQAFGE